jgi:pyranose oxidase
MDHPRSNARVEIDPALTLQLTGDEDERATVRSMWAVPFADPGHPFHGIVAHANTPLFREGLLRDRRGRSAFAGLAWLGRSAPRPENRVTFSDHTRDWCGMPAMTIQFELTGDEEAEAESGLRLVDEVAAALGRYTPDGNAHRVPDGWCLHYQGTVRMGEHDDGASVCDSHSRVWGFRNLFVGGNGVIPTATACNPTLTSVALAARAAAHVVDLVTSPQ